MPSAEAQSRLIRDTYAKAGLDPTNPNDRPQFFEAHGTGTPAGDPIEARAIHETFFPSCSEDTDGDQSLLVGSIKTVLGHTEGTAGLAGVLKASLAVQSGQIPANLHFRELNPKIRPFFNKLRVPTSLTPWPTLPKGQPRRVSVNSFGFGGTNAHAIIESWDGASSEGEEDASKPHPAGLAVLSANSAQALVAKASTLASFLMDHPDTPLDGLTRTLFQTADFPFRATFSGTSALQLADKLDAGAEALKNTQRSLVVPESLPPRILGVFTGQGAQWATMGMSLYQASAVFRQTIDQLQEFLDTLPDGDGPDWSILEELSIPKETSRVGIASISQPLCTALQVALVDVLHAAGVEFAAVVGHSSGEIGAAYAAGYLNARDAIRVAYYRGFHSHLAQGPDGKRGKMMAVGMGMEQAQVFCTQFGGAALKVAASNSPTSCTLAGDGAVIDKAKEQLDKENMFARVLAVDTAYHSHHMLPCASPYLESLRKCGVRALDGPRKCTWYSSVWGANGRSRSFDDERSLELLAGQYWVENLTNTVQFSQALSRAVNEEPFPIDLALEVGPHPALKGPSSEVIKSLTGLILPYGSVCKRGEGAVEALADGLGLLWTSFSSPKPMITFDSIHHAFPPANRKKKPAILKGLPTYPWDHNGVIWRESRASRLFRTQQGQPRHELLGHPVTLGEEGRREVHWRQVFKLNELPWVPGHTIQGQVIFPATGYLTMAFEAAVRLVEDQSALQLVELHNCELVRAMSLQEDSPGLEVVFTIRVTSQSDRCITAEVACYTGDAVTVGKLDNSVAGLTAHFSAGVKLWFGPQSKDTLPPRIKPLLPMNALDIEQFYTSLAKVGYNYSGYFKATSVERHLNHAVVTIAPGPESSKAMRASVHPTALDTAIQGLLAGFSFPEDGQLRTTYLPTAIDYVRINMAPSTAAGPLMADAYLTSADSKMLTGDVDLFKAGDTNVEVQMRGMHWTALNSDWDRWLYASEKWVRDAAYGIEPHLKTKLSPEDEKLRMLLNRTAHFYLRRVRDQIKPAELLIMSKHRKHMMKWIREHLFPSIEAGQRPEIKAEWASDTIEDVREWSAPYLAAGNNDMRILHAVGENLAPIARGTMPALQVMMKDGMLDRLYVEGVGFADGNLDFEPLVKQLCHRHPRMNVLEVGAGTGGTTRAVLQALGSQYTSYTYTDISAGFFEPAKAKFSEHTGRLTFKTLNIEKDPTEQGYEAGSYDLVLASNCVHATKTLQETMSNVRKLLRPGGYLLLLEITEDHLPIQLIMGTLPGWFLGIEDGRVWAPTISLDQWDATLKASGFTGVVTSSTPSYCSVIMSQATDENFQVLREPLAAITEKPTALSTLDQVLVVGASELATKSKALLGASVKAVQHGQLEGINVPNGAAVLVLSDLDSSVFDQTTQADFEAVQNIFRNASAVLWVTSGAASGKEPFANVTVGLGRTLQAERSELKLQILDADDPASLDSSMLATLLLQLSMAQSPTTSEEILWTHEPHLAFKNGALYIPRVLPLDDLNKRSSARIRQVTQETSLDQPDTAVEVHEKDGALTLLHHPVSIQAGELRVQVKASSVRAIVDGPSSMYLWIGRDTASGDKLIGVSRENSSLLSLSENFVLHRWANSDGEESKKDAAQLHQFMVLALAIELLSDLKGPVWVHGASSDLSLAIDRVATLQSLAVFQTTSDATKSSSKQRFVHPFTSKRDLQSLLPKGVKTLISLEHSEGQNLSELLRASLPSSTEVVTELEDQLSISLSPGELRKLAAKHFIANSGDSNVDSTSWMLPIGDVSSTEIAAKGLGPAAVIDWSSTDKVTTVVRPIDHSCLFSAEKTYVLFGMTSDLGISVSCWMVENGAQNVVMASRNPSTPDGVVEFMSQKGATLRTMAVDVTKKESLKAAITEIKSNMPPVGGIINGAMVLRDRLFVDMSYDDFASVLAPKVTGTQNLDKVFGQRDENLDFFICLSSATSLVGIMGQSAYSAANHYMHSLVRQRRERGLPGSAIVIGFLTGLGYIFRSDKKHLASIEESLLPRLNRQAEVDLHEMLAEAIVCGKPDSNQPAELISGVRTAFQGAWHDDPRLSSYLAQEEVQEETGNAEDGANIKVEAQLAAAKDPKEGQAVLEKCFANALGNMLQLDPNQIAGDVPVAELGVDSLVSVRIREWFLKELGVDVPILKIMSTNNSISRLCEDALAGWRKLQTGSAATAAPTTASREPEMDWEKEVTTLLKGIPALIPPGTGHGATPPRTKDLRVVLTGCTGFLGTHMIRHLVADPNVAEIHCLCIRSRHVKVQSEKIREYKGDLATPLLGLPIDDFARLCQIADAIIHVGAEVNHLKSYDSVRKPNVISTQTLLAMATPRKVPVHFISSSSVAMLQKDSSELAEVPASSVKPPTDAESLAQNAIGYAASKWMGELLLERSGLPAVVHRMPNVFGPDAPDEIPLVALDRYCTKMRAVPALNPKQWVGELDIIDVSVAIPEALANAFSHDPSKSPFAVHNYCSANRFLLSDLAGMYKQKLGGDIKVLPTEEFFRKATAMGMPKGVEVTFTGHDEVFVSPVLRKGTV